MPDVHYMDLVPYLQGDPMACWLDGPADHIRLTCGGCRWQGPVLELTETELNHCYGSLEDDRHEAAMVMFDLLHLALLLAPQVDEAFPAPARCQS